MKPLIQVSPRHGTDCAICSMATIAGITYEKALKLILPKRKSHASYGASIDEILDCFEKLKISVSWEKPIIKNLKNHSFLIIEVPYKNRFDLHAVVWDAKRKMIIDGYKESKSIRLYQNKVKYCFEIT